jgi:hypothetical protein
MPGIKRERSYGDLMREFERVKKDNNTGVIRILHAEITIALSEIPFKSTPGGNYELQKNNRRLFNSIVQNPFFKFIFKRVLQ